MENTMLFPPVSNRRTGAVVADIATIWTAHYDLFRCPPPIGGIISSVTADLDLVFTAACLARRPGDGGKVTEILQRCGLDVRERLVCVDGNGNLGKSNCDAEVGFALAEASSRAEVICCLLGDSDYFDAVRRLRDNGKYIRIVCHQSSLARSLRSIANEVISVEDICHETRSQRRLYRVARGGADIRAHYRLVSGNLKRAVTVGGFPRR